MLLKGISQETLGALAPFLSLELTREHLEAVLKHSSEWEYFYSDLFEKLSKSTQAKLLRKWMLLVKGVAESRSEQVPKWYGHTFFDLLIHLTPTPLTSRRKESKRKVALLLSLGEDLIKESAVTAKKKTSKARVRNRTKTSVKAGVKRVRPSRARAKVVVLPTLQRTMAENAARATFDTLVDSITSIVISRLTS